MPLIKQNRTRQPSETIMNKLSELGIDDSVDADDAAVGQVQAEEPEEEQEEESDDPLDAVDGGGDDEEDTFETPSLPKSNLRNALFAESAKRPVGRPKKNPPPASSSPIGYSDPIPTPPQELTYEQMQPITVPQPRVVGKVSKAPQAVQARGMGRLAAKLPGAEQVVVYKRNDKQQLALVGRYNLKDLTGFSNVDMFIFDMIKPKYGAGEYQVMGVDAMGREMAAGTVIIEDPPGQSQENNMVDLVKSLLDRQEKKEAAAVSQPITPVNPIHMLKDVHELQKSMAGPQTAPVKEDGTLAAVIAASGQQMQAVMQMMSQQQAQTTQLLIAAMAPKEDPMMKMLLAKLVEEKSSGGGMQGLPPLPPPPTDSMAGIKDILTMFMPLIAAYLKKDGGDDTKDLLKALIAQKDSEVLKPKEVIELMTSMQANNKGSDDFRKSVENLQMMTQITKALNTGNEGSSSAGFFDALAALFSNRDFAGSIAQAVRSKAETAQKKEVINAETHLLQKRGELLKQIRTPPSQPPVANIRPAPAQGPVGVPNQQNVVQMRQQVQQVTPHQVEQQAIMDAAKLTPQRPGFKLPPLPSGTPEHVKGLMEAKDDGELLGRTVQMLLYFAEYPEWQPMAEMLLGAIQQGEKDKSINIVRNVFTGFASMGMLTQDLAVRVIKSFIQNFDVIQAQVQDLPLETEAADPFEASLEGDKEEVDETEESDEDEEDGEEGGEDEQEEEETPAAG